MNSMGTPKNPLGGVRSGSVSLAQRMVEAKKGVAAIPQVAKPKQETQAYFKGGHF